MIENNVSMDEESKQLMSDVLKGLEALNKIMPTIEDVSENLKANMKIHLEEPCIRVEANHTIPIPKDFFNNLETVKVKEAKPVALKPHVPPPPTLPRNKVLRERDAKPKQKPNLWRDLSATTRALVSDDCLIIDQTDASLLGSDVELILDLEEVKALRGLIRAAEKLGILR